jgi:uncharacterized membrane protein YfcA
MTSIIILLSVGLVAGILSGLVGIGGGIVVVPVLVYFLGFNQHAAQGTVLAMFLLPIGILGVMNYYNAGHVDIRTALIIAITFVIGSYAGSKLAISFDQQLVKRIFGIILLIMSIKMISGK